MSCIFIVATLLWWSCAQASDFSVPMSWRKPTSNLTKDARQTKAKNAIDTMLPLFNLATGQVQNLEYQQSVNMLGAIALYDLITGEKTYESNVTSLLEAAFADSPAVQPNLQESDVSPATTLGLTSIYAYRAYRQQEFLTFATTMWNKQSPFVITTEGGAGGPQIIANITVAQECNKAPMTGGVLTATPVGPVDQFSHAATVGGFTALSAYLYEATMEDKYSQAAELSAEFMKNQLFNETIIVDRIDVHECTRVNEEAVTENSGLFIEGLSVFANLTGNATWADYLDEVIGKAIQFSGWTGPDGINFEFERGKTLKDIQSTSATIGERSILIRGLYEAWYRSDPTSASAQLIESYVTVQYNALLDLASNNTDYYSPLWHGPPVSDLLPWGQLAAMDTLNSAIGLTSVLTEQSPNSSTSTIPTPSTSVSASPSASVSASPPTSVSASPPTSVSASPSPPAAGVSPKTSSSRVNKNKIIAATLGPSILLLLCFISIIYIRHRGKFDRSRFIVTQFRSKPGGVQRFSRGSTSTSLSPPSLGVPNGGDSGSLPEQGQINDISSTDLQFGSWMSSGEVEARLSLPVPAVTKPEGREVRRDTAPPLVEDLERMLSRYRRSSESLDLSAMDPPPEYRSAVGSNR